MSKVKNPAIKLFGRTISLPRSREFVANGSCATAASVEDCSDQSNRLSLSSPPQEESSRAEREGHVDDIQEASRKELISVQEEDVTSHQTTEDAKSPTTTTATASSGIFENSKTPSAERETSLPKSSKNDEQSETSISQGKTLKKPDKILPCPRCNSMDTKFCYYNNYNVNQPRHFCKNCQRYWTAGGTMRNVPVGAGRRKNKNSSASHYRHIMVPEALQTAKASDLRNAVLTFGSDSPLCNSMASALNLAEKAKHGVLNKFHVPEKNIIVSSGGEDNGDNYSIGASVTFSTSSGKRGNAGEQESFDKHYQGHPLQVPCFPSSTWPSPWNSAQWSSPTPPPAIFPAGYSVSFYPTPAYWGCTVPATWNAPCISPQSSVTNSSHSSSLNSPNLGKHSREGNILRPANSQKEKPDKESSNSENSVLIPKTLRIDDHSEAAKSSTWSTLGIKNEKSNFLNGIGFFKGFPSKWNGKNHAVEASPVLQANPAAWSRSLNFQEQT